MDDDFHGVAAPIDGVNGLLNAQVKIFCQELPITCSQVGGISTGQCGPCSTPRARLDLPIDEQVAHVFAASVNNAGCDFGLFVEHPQGVRTSIWGSVYQWGPLVIHDQTGVERSCGGAAGVDARARPQAPGRIETWEGDKRQLLGTTGACRARFDGQNDTKGCAVAPFHGVGQGEGAKRGVFGRPNVALIVPTRS